MRPAAPTLALAALAVGSALVASGAAAAQEQRTVQLTGRADQACTLGQPAQEAGALVNFDTPGGSVFSVTQLTDPLTLTTRPAEITLGVEAMCNGSHRVVVASDSNGLWRENAGAPPAGFGSAVPYKVNLAWAGEQHLLNADGGARRRIEDQVVVGGPAAGDLRLEFQIQAGATNAGTNAPLLAGDYADVVRVTVEPQ